LLRAHKAICDFSFAIQLAQHTSTVAALLFRLVVHIANGTRACTRAPFVSPVVQRHTRSDAVQQYTSHTRSRPLDETNYTLFGSHTRASLLQAQLVASQPPSSYDTRDIHSPLQTSMMFDMSVSVSPKAAGPVKGRVHARKQSTIISLVSSQAASGEAGAARLEQFLAAIRNINTKVGDARGLLRARSAGDVCGCICHARQCDTRGASGDSCFVSAALHNCDVRI
jgi:hypothetical protein